MKTTITLVLSAVSAVVSPLAAAPQENDDIALNGTRRQESLENRQNRAANRDVGGQGREESLENRENRSEQRYL